MTRQQVLLLSAVATAVLTGLAWLILAWRGESLAAVLTAGPPAAVQLTAGAAIGTGLALAVTVVTFRWAALGRLRDFMRRMLDEIRPRPADAVLVSIMAGISEELLFRAALQPLIGLWLASLVFALAHIGMVPRDRPQLMFTAFVFGMGLVLGIVFDTIGLVAAIAAHAVYDAIVLLVVIRRLMTVPPA